MPPVADQPSTERIIGSARSSRVAGPLQASLVDEEPRNLVVGTTDTRIDAHWLPGGVELGILGHHQTPWKVVAEVEESVCEV